MKERPIIFSAESVRAILDGDKTQTRRVIKPQPELIERLAERKYHVRRPCPYGQVGDHLWVRETMYERDDGIWVYAADGEVVRCSQDDKGKMLVWAHHKEATFCASIHMPRWASRITLKIERVRDERLQDISEADAIAEGYKHGRDPVDWYCMLWNSINDRRPGYDWKSNPFVWAVKFRKVE